MTLEEAQKIFKAWQEYAEFGDKLKKVFVSIPESILPYPKDALEEASNIIAKDFFDNGDKKMADAIRSFMMILISHKEDAVAIEDIKRQLEMWEEAPELKEAYLRNLEKARKSWAKHRELNNY
ncbi:MAG: hypothetical protein ABH880_00460 [Patescibacteria group bacterium]